MKMVSGPGMTIHCSSNFQSILRNKSYVKFVFSFYNYLILYSETLHLGIYQVHLQLSAPSSCLFYHHKHLDLLDFADFRGGT